MPTEALALSDATDKNSGSSCESPKGLLHEVARTLFELFVAVSFLKLKPGLLSSCAPSSLPTLDPAPRPGYALLPLLAPPSHTSRRAPFLSQSWPHTLALRPPACGPLGSPSALARAPPRRLRRELLCPQLVQRGGGRGWAGASGPVRSMSRSGPRAAPGRTAARGLRESYAGPDPGKQQPPILSSLVPTSLRVAVPSGRRRGQAGRARARDPVSRGRRGAGVRGPGAGPGTRVKEGGLEPSAELPRALPGAPSPAPLQGTGRS